MFCLSNHVFIYQSLFTFLSPIISFDNATQIKIQYTCNHQLFLKHWPLNIFQWSMFICFPFFCQLLYLAVFLEIWYTSWFIDISPQAPRLAGNGLGPHNPKYVYTYVPTAEQRQLLKVHSSGHYEMTPDTPEVMES